jgi:hypothetical protein
MNEILVARKELAATLTSWAVARSVTIFGVPAARAAPYTSSSFSTARSPAAPGETP